MGYATVDTTRGKTFFVQHSTICFPVIKIEMTKGHAYCHLRTFGNSF